VTSGEGIHDWTEKICLDSHVDIDICQEPNGDHECAERLPHEDDHQCICGESWADVTPGQGEHDPQAEWDTCVLPYREHECNRRHPHYRPHGCSCGFEWEKMEDDEW
jgi:hypothetical protein